MFQLTLLIFFYAIILVNLLLLVLEPISFILDAKTPAYLAYFNYAVDCLIIVLTPLIVGLWASYIDYKLFKQQNRLRKRLYYQHVTILTFIGLLINFFTPVFFSIDIATNTYERGYLFAFRYVTVFALYTCVIIMNGDKNSSWFYLSCSNFINFTSFIDFQLGLILSFTTVSHG